MNRSSSHPVLSQKFLDMRKLDTKSNMDVEGLPGHNYDHMYAEADVEDAAGKSAGDESEAGEGNYFRGTKY